ncbi:Protein FAR1-RELATED SEQUENCE 5 [Glycine max]|nr:Protein FAR1-RELATED SEQUENCE 5 [Glycine max]
MSRSAPSSSRLFILNEELEMLFATVPKLTNEEHEEWCEMAKMILKVAVPPNTIYGEVSMSFAVRWKNVLDGVWHFVDKDGNYHNVVYNKDLDKPAIVAGWTTLRDEDVVRDIFWCHPNAMNTDKTNRYRLPLLDFVGVTPIGMTFSTGFAYLEGERLNNVVWALELFRGIFLRRDALPGVIVTDRDQVLMNAVKTIFPECTNLLCSFYINKNVKVKCKSLIGQRNA